MTYPRALKYLEQFVNYEQLASYRYPESFSLSRVETLLEKLGNPHGQYRTLHVAGTKGKGSTCAFAASILQEAGVRTGLYTSPHLVDFRERIQVDGRPIPREDLAGLVERTRSAVELPGAAPPELTYFEVITASAFLYFALRGVEVAVVEVGLGGRLDATNVLLPEVSAITPVGLDHLSKLGRTLQEIAREKSGILKSGRPAVIGRQRPEALEVIELAASGCRAPIHRLDQEVVLERIEPAADGTRVSLRTPVARYRDLRIPLLGRHQVDNAATAVRMVELLSRRVKNLSLDPDAVRQGLARTSWPGRCQLIRADAAWLLDGAQSAESARALRQTAEELFPGRSVILVAGVSTDKDLPGIARAWAGWPDRVIVTRADNPRAEPLERLQAAFGRVARGSAPERCGGVEEAVRRAQSLADREDLVVVTGSLFVVAEALEALKPALTASSSAGSGRGRRR